MNTKLKCLLLDDELPSLTYLKLLCEKMPNIEVVQSFVDPLLFLKAVPQSGADFCILDVEMPHFNGLEIANILQDMPVIFVTGYKEYALEAFEVNAIDFVSKPVNADRLTKAVDKMQSFLSKNVTKTTYLQVNTDKGKSIIFFDQIAYVQTSEIDSRDKMCVLKDNSTIVLKNMSFEKLLQHLPINDFVRINKSEIIAVRSIKHFTLNEITSTLLDYMQRPKIFFISDVYRQQFLELLKAK